MSVVLAVQGRPDIAEEAGLVYLASDTSADVGGRLLFSGEKYFELNDGVFAAQVGVARGIQLCRRAFTMELFEPEEDEEGNAVEPYWPSAIDQISSNEMTTDQAELSLMALADAAQDALTVAGFKSAGEDDGLDHDVGNLFVIGSRLFVIYGDACVQERFGFVALGAGQAYAEGVLNDLYHRHDLTLLEIADRAIRSAISLSMYCGGDPRMIEIKDGNIIGGDPIE